MKIHHRELICLNCDYTGKCTRCETKPEINCSDCEVARAFKKCNRKEHK